VEGERISGCALDVRRGEDLRALPGHEDEIGLDDVGRREHDVAGGHEETTAVVGPHPGREDGRKVHYHRLVLQVRRRRHIVLPVDQLVAEAVVREGQEIVVGERAMSSACHGSVLVTPEL
jgi:hypothetical protein